MSAISVKNLKKLYRYGIRGLAVAALDGVSFDVEEGEVFGLIGPNGAGKSTTIKILLGLLKPSAGECRIFGEMISPALRGSVGYLPESPYFYKFLSGFELVKCYAKLCGMKEAQARAAAMRALNAVGLDDAADRRVGLYSKGMVQRAGLAQAIVHNPKLVILDEPASGLDPIGAADMAETVLRLRGDGKTVLLCSHQMGEVEKLCSRAAILSRGKVAAMGKLSEMLAIEGVSQISVEGASGAQLNEIARFAEGLGVKSVSVAGARASLDEYFRKTVENSK